MKVRSCLGIVTGTVFGVLLVANCGNQAATMMTEVGEQLGIDMGGIGSSDGFMNNAKADPGPGPAVSAPCDKARVLTTTASGTTTVSTNYYAEFSFAGLTPTAVAHFESVTCDYEKFGSQGNIYFQKCTQPGCTESGYAPAEPDCVRAFPYMYINKVIVYCGYRTTQTGSATSDTGYRTKTAYLRFF